MAPSGSVFVHCILGLVRVVTTWCQKRLQSGQLGHFMMDNILCTVAIATIEHRFHQMVKASIDLW